MPQTLARTFDGHWHGGSPRERTLRPGHALFREGEQAFSIHLVLTGSFRIYRNLVDGRRHVIGFASPGDVAGTFRSTMHSWTCEAIAGSRVRSVPVVALRAMAEDDAAIANAMLRCAAREIERLQELSLLLCKKTAIEKVANFLLSICDLAGGPVEGQNVALVMPRLDIADHLGLSIETVSRSLTQLRASRLIDLPDRSTFVVRHLRGLAQLADT